MQLTFFFFFCFLLSYHKKTKQNKTNVFSRDNLEKVENENIFIAFFYSWKNNTSLYHRHTSKLSVHIYCFDKNVMQRWSNLYHWLNGVMYNILNKFALVLNTASVLMRIPSIYFPKVYTHTHHDIINFNIMIHTNWCVIMSIHPKQTQYCISRNFRGKIFSRIWLRQTFREF